MMDDVLRCDCTRDPEALSCKKCEDTGQLIEWQCADCSDWFRSEVQQPDAECWDWMGERFCDPCAMGQKLDAATSALRRAGLTLSPSLHGPLLRDVNSALQMAGEKPV